jgi:hypothetical protein
MFGEPCRARAQSMRRGQRSRQSQQPDTELRRQAKRVEPDHRGFRPTFRFDGSAALGADGDVGECPVSCIMAELTVDDGGDLVAKMRHAAPPS